MGLIRLGQNDVLPSRQQVSDENPRDVNFMDVATSMYATGFAGESIDAISRFGQEYDEDEGYDVFSDLGGYEGYADKFIGVESRQEAADIKGRIDRDLEANATIASGSGLEVVGAAIANIAVDPLNLIPIGGVAYRTYRTGGRILEGAAKTAAAGAAVSTAEEVALQQLQEVRTAEESFMNIGATTLLSGLLGGAAGAIGGRAELEDLARRLDEELTNPAPQESTAGAAQVVDTTLDDETLQSAFGLEKALSFNDPVLRTLNSPSLTTRQLSEQLAETYLLKNKNSDFVASQISVENMIKSYNLPKYKFFQDFDAAFLKYRQASSPAATRVKDVFGKARRDGKMTYHEFSEAVVKAARRNDEHGVPEVAEAARALRSQLFEPIFKRGIDAGIFEEGIQVKTAPSYVTRLWDKEKILADLPRWKEINAGWMRKRRDEALRDLDSVNRKIDALPSGKNGPDIPAELSAQLDDLTWRTKQLDEEIDNVVVELTNRITSTPAGRLPYDIKMRSERPAAPGKAQLRGAAKERVYDIPDELVEDFLVNDIDAITESYVRSLASDIELTKKFGSVDYTDQLKRMEEDYARLSHGQNAETQRKLKVAFDRDVRDFKAMWERLRGIYALPDDYAKFLPTAERTVLNFNYVRLLGGMTISAFTDIARPVMTQGLGNVYKHGVRGLIKNMKGFSKATEDVKQAGTALDMVLNTRARALAGMDDAIPFANRMEQSVGRMANNFGVLSLMSPWNSAMKQFSGVVVQSRIIQAVQELSVGGALGKGEITNLAGNFIDEAMAKRIAAQFKKYGQDADDVIIPNAQAWDDVGAQDVFRAAVRREVDSIIVTPGQDKPLWMSRPGWKLIGQFKSFAFSSVQRTMLSGLQRRDMATLNGAALSLFLGMGVYASKEAVAGRDTSGDWRVWLSEGVDRSGLTGWAFDANNIVEKVSRGRVGVNAIMGGPPMSRYASRSVLEAIFGPTYGAMGDVAQVTGSAFAGEWRESDTRTLRKLMPYQNLFYLRRLFDDAEEGVNKMFDVPESGGAK